MDRDTAVSTIKRRLGNRTDLETDIISEMQVMQTVLERDLTLKPWFLLTEISSTTTTADEERVPIPSDFLYESEEMALFRYDSTADEDEQWSKLERCMYDAAVETYKGATGTPVRYALVKDYYRLFPTPDAEYTLKLIYHKADTVLSSNVENEWLKYAPQLLIAETGMVMAAYLQNKIAYGFFSGLRDSERSRLAKETVAREVSNLELSMGGG